MSADECQFNPASLLPSLRAYGGASCHRVDVLAALALYVSAGGSRSAWLRLSRDEWQPTDPVVVGEKMVNSELKLGETAAELRVPIPSESQVNQDPNPLTITWPGVYVKNRRIVEFSPGEGSFGWSPDTFPAGVGVADALEVLNLQGSGLSCTHPPLDELIGLVSLKQLMLQRNNIQGNLPAPLLFLPNLREVHLDGKEHGGLKIAPQRTELLQTNRWPMWVSEALTGKLTYPPESANVAVSYHVEDGVIALKVPKQGLMQSVMSNEATTDAELTFRPVLDPFSRVFLVVSAILLLSDIMTDIGVAVEFANNGDYAWLAISISCLCLYATSAAWYTACALGSCSLNTIVNAVAAMLGLGGLMQVLQLLLLRPVTLSGRFNLTTPFKVTRYLATLHFLEAAFESLPQLVLQLYVRTVQGYSAVSVWGWFSLGISFLSVLRIVFMQDRQVQLAEAHELFIDLPKVTKDTQVHKPIIYRSLPTNLGQGSTLLRTQQGFPSIVEGPSQMRTMAYREPSPPLAASTIPHLENSSRVPSISFAGAAMLIVRVLEIGVATCSTVMLGMLWRSFAFLVPGIWLLLFTGTLTLTLACWKAANRRDRILPTGIAVQVAQEGHSQQRLMGSEGSESEWVGPGKNKRSLIALCCTSLSQGILCWFFTTAPLMLFPRFLPHAGSLVWHSSKLPLVIATSFVVARYAFFLVIASMNFQSSDAIIMGVVLGAPAALLSTLVITAIDLSVRCRRSCLLSGLWCDYDVVFNGKSSRGAAIATNDPPQRKRGRRRKLCQCCRHHSRSNP